jgi:hypothetical protein
MEQENKTIQDMQAIYRLWRDMWKLKGAEAEFLAKYGKEEKWLSQFKKQSRKI